MSMKLFRYYFYRLLFLFILGMVAFEFYMYLSITRDRRISNDKKFVKDYEIILCGFSAPKKRLEKPQNRCPNQGIVTSFRYGGLPTNMWQYANVIAASISTGMEAYIPTCLKETLEEVFDNLSLPLLSEIGHCFIPLPDSASSVEEWTDASQSIVIKSTDLYNKVVLENLNFLRTQFVFHSILKDIALSVLLTAKRNATNATFIGVYIAKTSIIVNQEYDDVFPSVQFFVDAMNYFRKEFSDAVFVVVADQKKFWDGIFNKKDTYLIEEESLDNFGSALAVLSSCNHTILASDDYGIWGAILSGGKAIASLSLSEDFSSLMQYNTGWHYLLNNTKTMNKFLERLL